MEPGDARVGDAVSSLSALLRHSDARVADAALRCFASLADRFARAHADPAPLAEHGEWNVVYQCSIDGHRISLAALSFVIGTTLGGLDTRSVEPRILLIIVLFVKSRRIFCTT